MAGHLVGNYKFHSEDNHRAFLKVMGAPDPMIERMMSEMDNVSMKYLNFRAKNIDFDQKNVTNFRAKIRNRLIF